MAKWLAESQVAAFCEASGVDRAAVAPVLTSCQNLFEAAGHLHGLTKTARPVVAAAALVRAAQANGQRGSLPLLTMRRAAPELTNGQRRQIRLAVAADPAGDVPARVSAILELAEGLSRAGSSATRIEGVHDDGDGLALLLSGGDAVFDDAAGTFDAARRWNEQIARPVTAVQICRGAVKVPWLIGPRDAVGDAVARLVRREVDQFFSRLYGLTDGQDVEYVHELRVALRRLRSAIRLFRKLLGDGGMQIRSEAGDLASALGEVRDADVFIEFLQDYEAEAQGDAAAFARRLIRAERRHRGRACERLVDAFDADALLAFRSRFEPASPEAAWLRPTGSAADEMICRVAPKLLRRRLRKTLRRADGLQGLSAERLHRVRIQCKRLRYSAEMFADLYDDRLDGLIDTMKYLQDALGEVHDSDVYAERVASYAERRSADPATQRGADALIGRLARHRQRSLRCAAKRWRAFSAPDAVEQVERMIASPRQR
jgi:CHAD domain-containing protein